MKMKRKIRKRCACGCGEITKPGNMYIHGHNRRGREVSAETKEKLSKVQKGNQNLLGHKHTAETIKKMSEAKKGKRFSNEAKLNMSLAKIKYDSDNPYCDVWKSREYKKDIRKDYCENVDCKKTSKKLNNHHIYLDKKRCAPSDLMTMCNGCHMILHHQLRRGNKAADPKDYIIINRSDHVSYIHKKSREIIKIRKAQ